MSFHLNTIRLFLLGAWLGAAIFFSAAVAPNAFGVLRTFQVTNASEIAGAIVSRTLALINISGAIIGLAGLIVAFGLRRFYNRIRFTLQLALLSVLTVATAVGEWVIAARMRQLRATLTGPIEQVPPDATVRVAFQALHGYSVASLSTAIIAGLIAFFVIAKMNQRVEG